MVLGVTRSIRSSTRRGGCNTDNIMDHTSIDSEGEKICRYDIKGENRHKNKNTTSAQPSAAGRAKGRANGGSSMVADLLD